MPPRSPALALVLLATCADPGPVAAFQLGARTDAECDEALALTEEAVDFYADVGISIEVHRCTVVQVPDEVRVVVFDGGAVITNLGAVLNGTGVSYFVDTIVDQDGVDYGGAAGTLGCASAIAVAYREPYVVAHEIGHYLGLGHDDREGNVMVQNNGVWPDAWLDDEQIGDAEEHLAWLQGCRDVGLPPSQDPRRRK